MPSGGNLSTNDYNMTTGTTSLPSEAPKNYKLILGSNSPRRRELLKGLGLEFEIRTIPGIDESYPQGLPMEEIPIYISRKKAAPYSICDGELLLTADTIVWLDGMVLGKPADDADAQRMLRMLSGKTHQVVTGVTLTTTNMQHSFHAVSDVTFASLSETEIEEYVCRFHPLDKAGAYGIQEWIGYIGVSSIKGSYFNVMGLPVQRLYTEMKALKLQLTV